MANELKILERDMQAARMALHSVEQNIAEREEQLRQMPAFMAYEASKEMLSEARKQDKKTTTAYREAVLEVARNMNVIPSRLSEAPHVTITDARIVKYNEDDILSVVAWIRLNGFWDAMVKIKTVGMVKKLEDYLPAQPLGWIKPLLWIENEPGARVDGGVWEVSENG